MDLKKRLAELDKLTRKTPSESVDALSKITMSEADGEITSSIADSEKVERTLSHLKLVYSEISGSKIWKREYLDNISIPPEKLPDLNGFFTNIPLSNPPLKKVLFLDTETTGLAGGTGTIPFLVGVSWFTGNGFKTVQYFLPGPGREEAVIKALAELAANFEALVTYNGASFDLPLLRTRSLLNRQKDPFRDLTNWDLLVPARRLWGCLLPNCRQQTLEINVCQRPERTGDISGHLIPQTWFTFLETGEPGLLPEVFHHNHLDMLGMADIFHRVLKSAEVLASGPMKGPENSWQRMWVIGRICERRREKSAAINWLSEAISSDENVGFCLEKYGNKRFVSDALRILKRGRNWQLIEMVILNAFASGLSEYWLYKEAAVLYEHRLPELEKALEYALLSGEDRRIDRLKNKLEKRVEG